MLENIRFVMRYLIRHHWRYNMRPHTFFSLVAATALVFSASSAVADTEDFDPARMWECHQADGTVIYTNKERSSCTLMDLKPLSIVPSLDNMPTHRPSAATVPYQRTQPGITGGEQNVPDWAQDWHASVASSGSLQAQVCSMYGEWLNINQKTRGGFAFGSDPSYGGDLSGQNQRGASDSFYNNARYVTLSKIFGQGFVPIGCP
jgi:hypothetical protein